MEVFPSPRSNYNLLSETNDSQGAGTVLRVGTCTLFEAWTVDTVLSGWPRAGGSHWQRSWHHVPSHQCHGHQTLTKRHLADPVCTGWLFIHSSIVWKHSAFENTWSHCRTLLRCQSKLRIMELIGFYVLAYPSVILTWSNKRKWVMLLFPQQICSLVGTTCEKWLHD